MTINNMFKKTLSLMSFKIWIYSYAIMIIILLSMKERACDWNTEEAKWKSMVSDARCLSIRWNDCHRNFCHMSRISLESIPVNQCETKCSLFTFRKNTVATIKRNEQKWFNIVIIQSKGSAQKQTTKKFNFCTREISPFWHCFQL